MNFFNMLELDQSSTLKKILSIMKLTVVFLIAFSLQISASVYSQTTKLSLNVQNQSIKDILYLNMALLDNLSNNLLFLGFLFK